MGKDSAAQCGERGDIFEGAIGGDVAGYVLRLLSGDERYVTVSIVTMTCRTADTYT